MSFDDEKQALTFFYPSVQLQPQAFLGSTHLCRSLLLMYILSMLSSSIRQDSQKVSLDPIGTNLYTVYNSPLKKLNGLKLAWSYGFVCFSGLRSINSGTVALGLWHGRQMCRCRIAVVESSSPNGSNHNLLAFKVAVFHMCHTYAAKRGIKSMNQFLVRQYGAANMSCVFLVHIERLS